MDAAKLNELKVFVEQCRVNPTALSDPSLAFFRDYLESMGAKLPPAAYSSEEPDDVKMTDASDDLDDEHISGKGVKLEDDASDDEIIESDIEFEGETVEPDNDPPQKMGVSSVEVTEEDRDASQLAKGKAMEAISEGNLDGAIEHLTEAIMLNPTSAIMYGTRAIVFIKMKKPNAAIRDADRALQGFAYVEFLEVEVVQNALVLNKSELYGRQLKVLAKRTTVPGMKQVPPRCFNPYTGFGYVRPYAPSYFDSPYGYGMESSQIQKANTVYASLLKITPSTSTSEQRGIEVFKH